MTIISWHCSVLAVMRTIDNQIVGKLAMVSNADSAAVPSMTKRGWGRVIFAAPFAHSAISRFGLSSLMCNLAFRHAIRGVTFNEVILAGIGPPKMDVGDSIVPLVNRWSTHEEVAEVVLMFCRTRFMTAQSLVRSGGLVWSDKIR